MPDATALDAVPSTAAVAIIDRSRGLRRGMRLLVVYGLVLALIAFWPVPVDRGAASALREISHVIPWLTYSVIETMANVVLFVPLGALLALVLPLQRGLVLPIALVTTLLIETGQGLFLAERTPSLRDIAANVLGAMLGLAIVRVSARSSSWRRAY